MTTALKGQLSDLLEQVAKSLDIPDEMYEEAVRKYEEVGHWLEEQDKKNGRREPKVYPQGSFRLGLVTRPITDTDDYDIDLVYERDIRKTSTTQDQLKNEAGEHLESFVRHCEFRDAPKLKPGARCWTLDYPDQFHMDVLPAIPDDEGRATFSRYGKSAILITDRDLTEWQCSNPIGYSEWFRLRMQTRYLEKRAAIARTELQAKGMAINEEIVKAAAEQVPEYKVKVPLQRAIQILKRHRDFYFQNDKDHRPVSIILTTLAAKAYDNEADLVDAILKLVRDMPKHIETRVEGGKRVSWVPNPINAYENFADRWQDPKYPKREEKFRGWLKKVDDDLTAALQGSGIHKVFEILGGSLGSTVVTKAAAAIGTTAFQQSQSGSLNMAYGTGALSAVASAPVPTTPVRRHTFYGDMDDKQGT